MHPYLYINKEVTAIIFGHMIRVEGMKKVLGCGKAKGKRMDHVTTRWVCALVKTVGTMLDRANGEQ